MLNGRHEGSDYIQPLVSAGAGTKARAAELNAAITLYAARKERLIAQIDRYLRTKAAPDWTALRVRLAVTIADLSLLAQDMTGQTKFLGTAPAAGRDMLLALDMKNATLQQLTTLTAPNSEEELASPQALRTALSTEVDAIRAAQEALTAYIGAKFIQKAGCPA